MLAIKQILLILSEKDEKERERMVAKLSPADAKDMLKYVLRERLKEPQARR
ncbi:MAG: hypothetical protein RR576_10090 [Oscillospiraceae bacterium]